MIVEERRGFIISKIESDGFVDIKQLALDFHVSKITIRRDLVALENSGLLRRVRGGAINSSGRGYEPPLILRNTKFSKAKQLIGKRAAELINEGDCIALDVGSTTSEVARSLVNRQNLTIITPSLSIASQLLNELGIRIILPGGMLRHGEASMVGKLTTGAFEKFFVDKLIMGVGGIDVNAGLTEYNWDDALVKIAMMKSAKQIIVVADSSKFNVVAFAAVAKLSQINHLVTDQMPPDDLRDRLNELGIMIDIVRE